MKKVLLGTLLLVWPVLAKPTFFLPPVIYAAPGLECNVYYKNIFDSIVPQNYAFQALSKVGTAQQHRWCWTPQAADTLTRHQLVIRAWDDTGVVAAVTTTVVVAANPVDPRKRCTVALFADSLTNAGYQNHMAKVLHDAGYIGYMPIGSRKGTTPDAVPHDGFGGYTCDSFLTRYAVSEEEFEHVQDKAERAQLRTLGVPEKIVKSWQRDLLRSPLVRFVNGKKKIDVPAYLAKVNGGQAPDVVIIELGVNSVFSYVGEAPELHARIRREVIPSFRTFLNVIRPHMPYARIAITTQPNGTNQDGFGANYGAKWNEVQHRKTLFALNRELADFVAALKDPLVELIPIAQCVDPESGYIQRQESVHARSEKFVTRNCNGVHLSHEGGCQIGDALAAWIACRWNGQDDVTRTVLEKLLPVPRVIRLAAGSIPVSHCDRAVFRRDVVPEARGDTYAESYRIDITRTGIVVTAPTAQGERYARLTLHQIKTLARGEVPCCTIIDWPMLRWRGYMNDCGRNFLDFEAVKAIVDTMAKYKMNLFHWHLSDYHGWRLESKKYPQLQKKEAFRRQIGKYYTQEQFRELIDYAAARGVTVMPELDVPGHTLAFRAGMGIDTMSAPGTDKVITELFEELCSLAPAEVMPFIHLGTDEVRVKAERCDDAWVSVWARKVNALGRKAVVWGPGKKLDKDIDAIDMAWYDNFITNTMAPVFDAARMYSGSWNAFEIAPRTFFTKPCRWTVASGRQIGAITCTWHDDNVGEDTTRLFRNTMVLPAIVGFADNYWHGRETDRLDLVRRLPYLGTPEFAGLSDFENRLAIHRDAFFTSYPYPFPFVKQTAMRWRVSLDGKVVATDVPQASLHMLGDKNLGIVGFTTNHTGVAVAETWIYSPVAQQVGAWIDFTCYGCAYGRLQGSSTPDVGEWNKMGAKIFLNEKEIAPPVWKQPNMRSTTKSICEQDVPYSTDLLEKPMVDEGCVRREPMPITFKAGWNHVKLLMPKTPGSAPWVGLFCPVLGTSSHPREVQGLQYRATKP